MRRSKKRRKRKSSSRKRSRSRLRKSSRKRSRSRLRKSSRKPSRSRKRSKYRKKKLYISATNDGKMRVSGRIKVPKIKKGDDIATTLLTLAITLGIPISALIGYLYAGSHKPKQKLKRITNPYIFSQRFDFASARKKLQELMKNRTNSISKSDFKNAFRVGTASGEGNRCFYDSVYQWLYPWRDTKGVIEFKENIREYVKEDKTKIRDVKEDKKASNSKLVNHDNILEDMKDDKMATHVVVDATAKYLQSIGIQKEIVVFQDNKEAKDKIQFTVTTGEYSNFVDDLYSKSMSNNTFFNKYILLYNANNKHYEPLFPKPIFD